MTSVEKESRNKGKDGTRFELLTHLLLLVLLLRRFAGGGYKGVRILYVCLYQDQDALRDTCIKEALLASLNPRAKHNIHVFTAARLHTLHIVYIHIIQIDHHGSFMRHPSLVPSHPPILFHALALPSGRPLPSIRLLFDLDPPFPIPFHPSTNPLTIAHVFNNSINK
jgi:hypothetical protein